MSHPYTDAQRSNPLQVFWSLVARGVPSVDPSFEPWHEHVQPAIVRARIADWIDRPLTNDQQAEWMRPSRHTQHLFHPDDLARCKRYYQPTSHGSLPVKIIDNEDGICVATRGEDDVVTILDIKPNNRT